MTILISFFVLVLWLFLGMWLVFKYGKAVPRETGGLGGLFAALFWPLYLLKNRRK